MLEYLSIYLDAHFGDYAIPAPDGPEPGCRGHPAWHALSGCNAAPVERAIELGCGVGRGLHILAEGAELTVGVEAELCRTFVRTLDFARRNGALCAQNERSALSASEHPRTSAERIGCAACLWGCARSSAGTR